MLVPPLVSALFLLIVLAAPIGLLFCARLLRRQGFDTYDLRRVSRTLLMGPTSDKAPWRKPEVARMLLPAKPREGGDLAADPQTPTAIAQALSRLSGESSGESRPLMSETAESARQLAASLASLEDEIARLAKQQDPMETERLKERISRLGPGQKEDVYQSELRDLLLKQLALLERCAQKREEAEARRARLLELLSDLWKAARRLRQDPAQDPAALHLLRRAVSESRSSTGDDLSENATSTSLTRARE